MSRSYAVKRLAGGCPGALAAFALVCIRLAASEAPAYKRACACIVCGVGGDNDLVLVSVRDRVALDPDVILLADSFGLRNDLFRGLINVFVRIVLA